VVRCRLRMSYQTDFIAHGVKTKRAKRMDSIDAVKRHSKNDFYVSSDSSYDAPYSSWVYDQPYPKRVPRFVVESAKAQGSKAKPIGGLEPPRATRARDKATQRVTNILVHPGPHRGDTAPSSFVSEPGPGGFLHSPLWAVIYSSEFSVSIT
jgi:hypothetical protein